MGWHASSMRRAVLTCIGLLVAVVLVWLVSWPRSPSIRPRRAVGPSITCCGEDVAATGTALQAEGIEVAQPISHQSWGLLNTIPLPGGVEFGLYEPRHRTAAQPSRAHRLSHTISACK
jgi:hypothetical protein